MNGDIRAYTKIPFSKLFVNNFHSFLINSGKTLIISSLYSIVMRVPWCFKKEQLPDGILLTRHWFSIKAVIVDFGFCLLFSFLYEFFHDPINSIFKIHPNYSKIRHYLLNNTLVKAIVGKAEYYYYLRYYNDLKKEESIQELTQEKIYVEKKLLKSKEKWEIILFHYLPMMFNQKSPWFYSLKKEWKGINIINETKTQLNETAYKLKEKAGENLISAINMFNSMISNHNQINNQLLMLKSTILNIQKEILSLEEKQLYHQRHLDRFFRIVDKYYST